MTVEGQVLTFLTVGNIIIEPISTLSVMFFIYGVYAILFGICIRILCRRQGRPNLNLYLFWTITLFALTTVANVLETFDYIQEASREFQGALTREYYPVWVYLHHDTLKSTLYSMLNGLWIVTNITADSMLIHRCYVIWGSRKRVALILGVLSLAINAFGIVTIVQSGIGISNTNSESKYQLFLRASTLNTGYNIANAIINVIITSMTGLLFNLHGFIPYQWHDADSLQAGRIWWITRQARAVMGAVVNHRYKTIVAIIVESGLLYPLFMVPYLVLAIGYEFGDNTFGLLPINFTPIIWQVAGIAPTLIIVRAGSGQSVESVNQMTTIHFVDTSTETTNQNMSPLTAVELRSMENDDRSNTKVEVTAVDGRFV
ncbi:hypothetical protein VNI00_013050 [Paramarasmius palmivorus]|uniref:Gustatory receptor n=1 Tax=Paramarasmius palmivorus TaxID=297713 RepID=A0AAW0C1D9_9AGAR